MRWPGKAAVMRPATWVVGYVQAGPVTVSLLVAVIVVHVWLRRFDRAVDVVAWSSTNVDNLARHPVGSLVASLVFVDRLGAGAVITICLGLGGAMWWLEAHRGWLRAATVFLAAHVGGSLLTAGVIVAAVAAGRYPTEVRTAVDVGVSYGAEARWPPLSWPFRGGPGRGGPCSSWAGPSPTRAGMACSPTSPPSDTCSAPRSASSWEPCSSG